MPFPRSILCHQLILLISSIKAAVGAAIGTLPEMRCATGPDRARGILENGPRVNSKITRAGCMSPFAGYAHGSKSSIGEPGDSVLLTLNFFEPCANSWAKTKYEPLSIESCKLFICQ